MQYEQFFPFRNDDNCNCYDQVKITVISITCFLGLIKCVLSCRDNRKIEKLKVENNTLKEIILKSVDQTFTKLLKNGYDIDDSDED